MGLFRDARKLTALSKEIQKDWDPVAQMRSASTQMSQLAQQASLASSPTAISAPATVGSVRETGAMINNVAMYVADVMVVPDGAPPFASTLTVHGATSLTLVQPGRSVRVRYEPSDTASVVLDSGG